MKLTADTERISFNIQRLRGLAEDVRRHKETLTAADSALLTAWSGLSAEGFMAAKESLETNLEKWIQGMEKETALMDSYLNSLIAEEISAANQILMDIKGCSVRDMAR